MSSARSSCSRAIGIVACDGSGVPRDHSSFVGFDHEHWAGAVRGVNAPFTTLVLGRIQTDAESAEPAAGFLANRRGVLADPAREHQDIHTTERGYVAANRLTHGVAQHGDGALGAFIAR